METPSEHDQVVFHLSLLSNLASQYPGISDKDLGQKITDQLKGPLASWKICWGPHVVQNPIFGTAINTMYVAKENGQENYVVAIAGTNPYSLLDWFGEDLWIQAKVPWIFAPLAGAKISSGTAIGLVILQNMKPEEGAENPHELLWDFLKSLVDSPVESPVNLTVTGHSLGGALSPTLALWLLDMQVFWDPHRRATVMTMPSAGPTAGDENFAAHSDAMLPNRLLPSNQPASFRYANSLDVVPHAWNLGTLKALKTLYEPNIPENGLVDALVEAAIDAAADGDYTQIAPPDPPWKGTVNQKNLKPNEPFLNYLRQLIYQHVEAYTEHFALGDVLPAPKQISIPQRLVARLGLTLPADFTVSPEPPNTHLAAFVTDDADEEQDWIDALVAKMKKFGPS